MENGIQENNCEHGIEISCNTYFEHLADGDEGVSVGGHFHFVDVVKGGVVEDELHLEGGGDALDRVLGPIGVDGTPVAVDVAQSIPVEN